MRTTTYFLLLKRWFSSFFRHVFLHVSSLFRPGLISGSLVELSLEDVLDLGLDAVHVELESFETSRAALLLVAVLLDRALQLTVLVTEQILDLLLGFLGQLFLDLRDHGRDFGTGGLLLAELFQPVRERLLLLLLGHIYLLVFSNLPCGDRCYSSSFTRTLGKR